MQVTKEQIEILVKHLQSRANMCWDSARHFEGQDKKLFEMRAVTFEDAIEDIKNLLDSKDNI